MERLGLGLIPGQYGTTATQKERDRSQLSINADAFMHPIVNAYRFDEAMAMFKTCDVHGRELCLQNSELFKVEALIDPYKSLPKVDQLKVIELSMKPTGFTILAGRNDSFKRLGSRIAGNMILKEDLPDPYPRLYRV